MRIVGMVFFFLVRLNLIGVGGWQRHPAGLRQRRAADGRDIIQNGESFGHAHSTTVIRCLSNMHRETH